MGAWAVGLPLILQVFPGPVRNFPFNCDLGLGAFRIMEGEEDESESDCLCYSCVLLHC